MSRRFSILPRKEIINGCLDSTPLLTRWKLLQSNWLHVFVHRFHRSDEDRELHSHPWAFVSIILWNGYVEVTPRPDIIARLRTGDRSIVIDPARDVVRRRYRPGSVLFRPTWWAHRVEILPSRPSLSLVIAFKKSCPWGFFTATGWVHDKLFHSTRGCV